MKLTFDPQDLITQIGEALGLIVTAIAQEHDAPQQLLDAMHRAVEKCTDHPQMYSPLTLELVRHATKGLEGSIQAATDRQQPN